jgi:hypothetical protein
MADKAAMGPEEISSVVGQAGYSVLPDAMMTALSADGIRATGFIVPRTKAWDLWLRFHDWHSSGSGWYPVLSEASPRNLVQSFPGEFPAGGRHALEAAVARDPDEIISEVLAAFVVDSLDKSADHEARQSWLEILTPEILAESLAGPIETPRLGDPWAGSLASEAEFWLCLVEARQGYELPILLPGVPHTPNWWVEEAQRGLEPADHLAFLRSWQRRYGAEPFYLDGNNLRLAVARPPLTPLAAAEAAIELFAYSSDGAPDLPVLADGEIRSTVWTCWWD